MTPYQLALLAAESSPFVDTLQDDLQAHLHNGVVISSPDYFAMFRPVWSHWPEDILLTPAVVDPEGDAWFVWACAGDWRKAIEDGRETAGHKAMLLFHRRGKLRCVAVERLLSENRSPSEAVSTFRASILAVSCATSS